MLLGHDEAVLIEPAVDSIILIDLAPIPEPEPARAECVASSVCQPTQHAAPSRGSSRQAKCALRAYRRSRSTQNLPADPSTSRCKRAAAPETQLAGGLLQHEQAARKADINSSLHRNRSLPGQARDSSRAVLLRRAVLCSG